jgi:hypothetical protein
MGVLARGFSWTGFGVRDVCAIEGPTESANMAATVVVIRRFFIVASSFVRVR